MDPAHVPYAHYGLMRTAEPKGRLVRYIFLHLSKFPFTIYVTLTYVELVDSES